MGYGAAAVAHLADGRIAFVEGGAPGDLAEIELTSEKKRFVSARVIALTEPGTARVHASDCAAGDCNASCGGCPWAHLTEQAQLEAKRANVIEALVRVGRIDRTRVEKITRPCAASKRSWGYRNKLELGCSTDLAGRLLLGLHNAESSDISPITTCPLACKPIAAAPKALQGALRYLGGTRELGLFRVGVRGSLRTRDVEVALWTEPGPFPRAEVARVIGSAVRATSIVRVIAQPGKARKIKGVEKLEGKGAWEEELAWGDAPEDHARYLTSAPSFFQVNTAQAERLVNFALEGLRRDGFSLDGALVADLYAGGGTFSIPLARAGAEVIAVESAGSSVRDLRRNAEMNGEFIEVIGGDAKRELPEIGGLDALLVDPPRAGLATGIVESIAAAAPERIAYVSCDPQTLARDIALFETNDYVLESVQPVDLFPQTYHVETVAILRAR